MPYVGNIPAEKYASFEVQHFTTSATTTYSLTHAVANENDIRLVINNVIQQPGSGKAYTASGTTLTLSSATSGTDTMYCVFLGKAVQTVVPPAGSVTGSTLADDVISAQSALGAVPADTDEFLISDAGVLKKVDYSYLKHTYIDWQTSSIKTSGFTAVAGQGYFCNTTSGGFTVTLPAGVAGQQIAVKDYARTFASGNLTIASNGSEKIQGSTSNSELKTAGGVAVLTYVDSTKGWLYTEQDNVSSLQAPAYVTATGGTITTSGDYKIHTFLASSTFNVSDPGNSGGSDEVEVLVVGGGASGGGDVGGGGGAGGLIHGTITATLTATNYTVTVGAGGAGTTGAGGNNGVDSYFAQGAAAGLECKGAGGGRGGDEGTNNGSAGGSGGGAAGGSGSAGASSGNVAAAGTTAYGNAGGTGTSDLSGGGGGAGGAGSSVSSGTTGGNGAGGRQVNIDGNNYYWAAGGGGAAWMNGTGGAGGTGGGGGGSSYYTSCAGGSGGAGGGTAINAGGAGQGDDNAQSGSGGTNSGSGGGGAGNYWGACSQQAGNGGSGIVIVKYKFQN